MYEENNDKDLINRVKGLWCVIFQLYRGGQFSWWRKPEYPEKTTDLSQVTDLINNFSKVYLTCPVIF